MQAHTDQPTILVASDDFRAIDAALADAGFRPKPGVVALRKGVIEASVFALPDTDERSWRAAVVLRDTRGGEAEPELLAIPAADIVRALSRRGIEAAASGRHLENLPVQAAAGPYQTQPPWTEPTWLHGPLAWVAGVAGLVVLLALGTVREWGDPARLTGAIIGSLCVSLGIAAVIRWAIVREHPGRPVWSAPLLLIAAALAAPFTMTQLVLYAAGVGHDENKRDLAGEVAKCRSESDPAARFQRLPPGFAVEPVDAQDRAELAHFLSTYRRVAKSDPELRYLTENETVVGLAAVFAMPDEMDEAYEAMVGTLGPAGFSSPKEIRVPGARRATETGFVEQGERIRVIYALAGCHMVMVAASEPGTVRRITAALAGG